jgi:hypothetical protein
VWVVFGTKNLCCNWVKFSKEFEFQFSHKLLCFEFYSCWLLCFEFYSCWLLCFEFCSCWFCSRRLDHTFTRFFLESKIIENFGMHVLCAYLSCFEN